MLEALTELGFLEEYDKRVFKCVRDSKMQKEGLESWSVSYAGLKERPGGDISQFIETTRRVVCMLIDR
jgi:hypothetical protein